MARFITSLGLLTLIFSCQHNLKEEPPVVMDKMYEEVALASRQSFDASPTIPVETIEQNTVDKKKIIKDGQLGLRVTDLDQAKSRVDSIVKAYKGYYANESFNNTEWESSYSLRIRVPGNDFENLITAIETGKGELLYKVIDARDVTDQFIDLETRLESKRNYLTRYYDLLKQAKTIKDILDIEERIRVLQEEVESTTGRLRYLSDRVDLSTLDLNLSKKKEFIFKPAARDKFFERLKQSISKGWFGLVDFLIVMVRIWPIWLMLALAAYFWKIFYMNRKKHK